LQALNPVHCFQYLFGGGPKRFFILGEAILAVTGTEDLYLDMGHFGRKPIQLAWIFLVFPSLVVNYMGQVRWIRGQFWDFSGFYCTGFLIYLLIYWFIDLEFFLRSCDDR
jgi:K+ transporter